MELRIVLDEFKEWVKGLIRTEAKPPLWLAFPSNLPDAPGTRLIPNADYFRVRVHRIHLTYERQWFEKFSPMLLIATEFSYDGKNVTQPAVIGPAMIEQLGRAAPVSSTIAGSIVAGPYPLRDVSVSVTVALHRIARSDNAGDFLDVVEGAAKALDIVAGLSPYTALARVVVTGLTALTGGDRPLIARRDEFSPVLASYYALISQTSDVSPESLVINNGELSQRVNGQLRPFRSADYVVYSLDRVGIKDVDITRLPLYRQWLTVLGEATQADTSQVWKSAKANLSSLVTMAFTSPDLTYGHAEALEEEWIAKVLSRRDRARTRGDMGGQTQVLDDVRSRALAVLDL
jgi:hypothetical protein